MNNSYFNPNLVGNNNNIPGSPLFTNGGTTPNQETAPYSSNSNLTPNIPILQTPREQDYIENVLQATVRLKLRVYMTFPDSVEWRDRIFEGILEGSGRDHLVLSDPKTGNWLIIPLIYVDYYEFLESLENYIK